MHAPQALTLNPQDFCKSGGNEQGQEQSQPQGDELPCRQRGMMRTKRARSRTGTRLHGKLGTN